MQKAILDNIKRCKRIQLSKERYAKSHSRQQRGNVNEKKWAENVYIMVQGTSRGCALCMASNEADAGR